MATSTPDSAVLPVGEHRDVRAEGRVRRALLGLIARLHRWAESGSAGGAVCTWNCLQGSIVPGPSEALFLPLGLADPRRALRLAAWAAFGAIAGGLIAYGIGAFAFESVGRPLFSLFGMSDARWASLAGLFQRHGAMLVLLSTVSPLSTKFVCIGAGAFGVPFWPYVLALVLGRAGRFGVLGLIVRFAGDRLSHASSESSAVRSSRYNESHHDLVERARRTANGPTALLTR